MRRTPNLPTLRQTQLRALTPIRWCLALVLMHRATTLASRPSPGRLLLPLPCDWTIWCLAQKLRVLGLASRPHACPPRHPAIGHAARAHHRTQPGRPPGYPLSGLASCAYRTGCPFPRQGGCQPVMAAPDARVAMLSAMRLPCCSDHTIAVDPTFHKSRAALWHKSTVPRLCPAGGWCFRTLTWLRRCRSSSVPAPDAPAFLAETRVSAIALVMLPVYDAQSPPHIRRSTDFCAVWRCGMVARGFASAGMGAAYGADQRGIQGISFAACCPAAASACQLGDERHGRSHGPHHVAGGGLHPRATA
jgi:hypothetical protein